MKKGSAATFVLVVPFPQAIGLILVTLFDTHCRLIELLTFVILYFSSFCRQAHFLVSTHSSVTWAIVLGVIDVILSSLFAFSCRVISIQRFLYTIICNCIVLLLDPRCSSVWHSSLVVQRCRLSGAMATHIVPRPILQCQISAKVVHSNTLPRPLLILVCSVGMSIHQSEEQLTPTG